MQRPCLGRCGRLIRSGSWCEACAASRGGLGSRGSTRRWRGLRAAVVDQVGARCAECGSGVELQVHHAPDGRLLVLCADCHRGETYG
jgi:hypothetical protein